MAYSDVLKQIAPLEAQLARLKAGLADSQERLKQCQAELGQLDEQVHSIAFAICYHDYIYCMQPAWKLVEIIQQCHLHHSLLGLPSTFCPAGQWSYMHCSFVVAVDFLSVGVSLMMSQVAHLKSDFQLRIREAEALKLELGRAEATLSAASGATSTTLMAC
jgi:regulator of replication initiation timing